MSAPAPQTQTWYLLKHGDNNIFGPASFEQLRTWATEAQVSPLDKISTDQTSWLRAPMLPDLGMDWLVEVTSEHCYGPTSLGSVREFLLRGEIGPETVLINARDNSSQRVGDIAELMEPPPEEDEPEAVGGEPTSPVDAAPLAVDEQPAATAVDGAEPAGAKVPEPGRTGLRFSLQQRVRALEADLLEERRLLTALTHRYGELESKYIRLLGHQRASSSGGVGARAEADR